MNPLSTSDSSSQNADSDSVGKEGFPHFMLKEIYEEPEVLQSCLAAYLPNSHRLPPRLNLPATFYADLEQIHMLGSGTSRHAALVAQYWLEQIVGVPTRVRSPSEFLSAPLPLTADTLTIAITQSGETADTLAAVNYQKSCYTCLGNSAQQKLLGITNQPASSLSKMVDHLLPTLAGTEVGVAATKTFTNQLAVLACLTLDLAIHFQLLDDTEIHQFIATLESIPMLIETVLKHQRESIQQLAHLFIDTKDCIVLGQGVNRAIALEGALKLKETSYIHAEGYAAGEFLHGPMALLDPGIPVIAIAPPDQTYKQVLATVRKIKSHHIPVIGITTASNTTHIPDLFDHTIILPLVDKHFSPFLTTIPLQLLAYHIAIQRGLDVDRPRNITKTVL